MKPCEKIEASVYLSKCSSTSKPLRGFARKTGFTLIELLVTIAIIVILMAIADPSYRYITNSNRIAAEINGLLGDLQYARSEAIKRGQDVTVCESSDGTTCGSTTSWQSGWIVFADPNANQTVDTGETVLRVQKKFTSTDTFSASNTVSSITFNREGFAAGIANGTLITLHDQTNNSKWTRCLSVNLSGLAVTETYNTTINGVTCT